MLQFFQENWKIVLICVLLLVNFIILLCKKTVKISDSIWTLILTILPGIISNAEKIIGSGNGADKLTFVLTSVMSFLKDKCKLDDNAIASYVPDIKKAVEDILTTPQKKEGD